MSVPIVYTRIPTGWSPTHYSRLNVNLLQRVENGQFQYYIPGRQPAVAQPAVDQPAIQPVGVLVYTIEPDVFQPAVAG